MACFRGKVDGNKRQLVFQEGAINSSVTNLPHVMCVFCSSSKTERCKQFLPCFVAGPVDQRSPAVRFPNAPEQGSKVTRTKDCV